MAYSIETLLDVDTLSWRSSRADYTPLSSARTRRCSHLTGPSNGGGRIGCLDSRSMNMEKDLVPTRSATAHGVAKAMESR